MSVKRYFSIPEATCDNFLDLFKKRENFERYISEQKNVFFTAINKTGPVMSRPFEFSTADQNSRVFTQIIFTFVPVCDKPMEDTLIFAENEFADNFVYLQIPPTTKISFKYRNSAFKYSVNVHNAKSGAMAPKEYIVFFKVNHFDCGQHLLE